MVQVVPQIFSGTVDVGLGKQNTTIYCVLSDKEALIVDAGFYAPETEKFFQKMLKEHTIDPRKAKLFITHSHVDHIGMAGWCSRQGMEILRAQQEVLQEFPFPQREPVLRQFGVPDNVDCSQLDGQATYPATIADVPFTPVHEGDVLTIGRYHFSVVALPGHADDQMGLYDMESGTFFCGDHILPDIVPMIPTTEPDKHHLQTYFESIWKVSSMDPAILLPGHGNPITSADGLLNRALDRITNSYQSFTDLVEHCLCEQPGYASVFALGQRLYHTSESDFFRKGGYPHFLMLSKIMTSLEYLFATGKAYRMIEDGIPYYSGKNI